jgi:ribonuclease HI
VQKAEHFALTRALQLTAGILVNIYTDSKYVLTTIHNHGTLYKERKLINSGGKSIKYGQEILKLLDVVWAPKWVAVMHCQGHRREMEQLPGETRELTKRPSKWPSQGDQPQLF